MIVGLGHQARVGKDTAATILVDRYGFKRLAFADALKAVAYDTNPWIYEANSDLQSIIIEVGIDSAKEEYAEIRRFYQNLGVAAREHIDPDVWVEPVVRQILFDYEQAYVITDVRFPNEFTAIRDAYGFLVKLTRPGIETNAGSHVSETALDDAPWDVTIANDSTFEALEANLVKVLGL